MRLSKTIIEKYKITDKVEIILEKGQIVLKPINEPRAGWEQAFQKMNQLGDDSLKIKIVFQEENFEEWK